jgi:PTH1 family peptidyl-tRNA hydrolase
MPDETWLVVGLGNPGENYRPTRHNVGFRVVEALGLKHNVKFREKDQAIFGSWTTENVESVGDSSAHQVEAILFFPQTFMNESGKAAAPFARYRNIPPEKILVVSDDLDLPVGKIRLRVSGGSGGHHGLDSIISHLGSSDFPRLRIGISKPPSPEEGAHHVLATFTPEEKPKIEQAIERARDGIEAFILFGPEVAMNRLNRDPE